MACFQKWEQFENKYVKEVHEQRQVRDAQGAGFAQLHGEDQNSGETPGP
jgi:hypothetical protein